MPSQRTLKASRGIGEQPSLRSRAPPAVWRDENAPHTQEPTRSQLVETLRDLHTALRLSRQREESSLQLIREMRHELQKVYKLLASYDCGLTNACMLMVTRK